MRLGKDAMEALKTEVGGLLKPGDELVVAGAVALKGTSLIAENKYDLLREVFSGSFLGDAMALRRNYGVGEIPKESVPWRMAGEAGANVRFAMGEGGFLSALWKVAEASQTGLRADLRKVPVRQETIEICEVLDINPYYLLSEGSVLIGIPSGEALVEEFLRMGIPAAVIGHANEENDRLLYSRENVRYLDRPAEDEIKGVMELWQD
ncbi:MAG: AIR synthase-related protein [Eubacteriales bacterium]|nr:AIR synthase-related protein [Eubacteriales bacterium]